LKDGDWDYLVTAVAGDGTDLLRRTRMAKSTVFAAGRIGETLSLAALGEGIIATRGDREIGRVYVRYGGDVYCFGK